MLRALRRGLMALVVVPVAVAVAPAPMDAQHALLASTGQNADTTPLMGSDLLGTIAGLNVANVTLSHALEALVHNSGVAVAYSPTLLPRQLRVSCACETATVQEALGRLLMGTGFEVFVAGGQVVLGQPSQRSAPPLAPYHFAAGVLANPSTTAMAARFDLSMRLGAEMQGTITGRVLDAQTGQPLAAAQVSLGDGLVSALTQENGSFILPDVPVGTHTITVQRIGYLNASQEITVAEGQTVTVEILLNLSAVGLDEIVAIGYGTARRRDVTGSIASVSGEDALVRAAPNISIANTLQGRAAGVQVISNSGAPGGGASVQIRGSNSITANSQPLYIVDGIPFGQGSGGTDNPLATIDPNNIESIQILKDASATAIYGARGANGVVIITTQRGEVGTTRFQVEASYGLTQQSKEIDVLNAQEFMTMANEANVNAGRAPRYSQAEINSAQTYDYLGMLLRDSHQQGLSVTASGGDLDSRFLISGSYLNQEGLIIKTNFERFGGRINLDRTLSDRFRVGTRLNGTYSVQNIANAEEGGFNAGVTAALNFAPYVPPKDENGNWVKLAVTTDQTGNPVANQNEIENPQYSTRLIGNVFGEFDVLPNLVVRSTLGGNIAFDSERRYAPRTVSAGGVGGVATRSEAQTRELVSESTITYEAGAGPGSLSMLGGFSVQTHHSESTSATTQNFPVDQTKYHNVGTGSEINAPSSNILEWALVSYLGRLNYNLLDRYMFTVTARRDGSSRFGANNKWAFFPSAAFAWRISDEPFMLDQDLFSDLRLRLSVGRTGNQAVSEYASLAALSTSTLGMGAGPDNQIALAPSSQAANPDLRWETQQQINVGVDVAVLNNRVMLSMDAYRTTTSDLLLGVQLSSLSGYSSQLQNIGSVRNRGVELSLTTINLLGDDRSLSWSSTLNVAANRNEVLDIGGVDQITVGGGPGGPSFVVQPGLPLSSMMGYKVLGLYQQGDACNLINTSQCAPGEFKVQDTDGNGIINNDDRVILGDGEPTFYGGFSNTFRYRGFSIDAIFNFSVGNKVWNLTKSRNSLVRGVYNERREVLNRWTPENTNTMVPRANADRPSLPYSVLMEDGTFVRLQTLTIGYSIPENLIPGASSANLYLTGQNLWLLSDYTGFDPEVNTFGGDARRRGLDNNAMPRPRTWNFGINVAF